MNGQLHNIAIRPDGTIRFIYTDDLIAFVQLGKATIRRASHVEPAPGGGWTADMTPLAGPILGPFKLRKIALNAEVQWITTHYINAERVHLTHLPGSMQRMTRQKRRN